MKQNNYIPQPIDTIGVELPDGLETIGTAAFAECIELSSIKLPNSIETSAKVILPDALRTIKQYAFDECKSLTEVVIPSKKVVIEYKAFPKNCEISYNRKWFLFNRI